MSEENIKVDLTFKDEDFSNMLDRLNEFNEINYLNLSLSSQIMGLKLIIKDARKAANKFLETHRLWLIHRLDPYDGKIKIGYEKLVDLIVQKFEYDLNNIINMICKNFSEETVENMKQHRSTSDSYNAMSFLNMYFETCDKSILEFMMKNSKGDEDGIIYYNENQSLNDVIMELIDDEISYQKRCKDVLKNNGWREAFYCKDGMIRELDDPDVDLFDPNPKRVIIDKDGNVREIDHNKEEEEDALDNIKNNEMTNEDESHEKTENITGISW